MKNKIEYSSLDIIALWVFGIICGICINIIIFRQQGIDKIWDAISAIGTVAIPGVLYYINKANENRKEELESTMIFVEKYLNPISNEIEQAILKNCYDTLKTLIIKLNMEWRVLHANSEDMFYDGKIDSIVAYLQGALEAVEKVEYKKDFYILLELAAIFQGAEKRLYGALISDKQHKRFIRSLESECEELLKSIKIYFLVKSPPNRGAV